MKRLLILIAAGLLTAGGYWYWHSSNGATVSYRTAAVERGDLQMTINATGVLQPEEVVDIGAQVAGMIRTLGPDPRNNGRTVDYGTPVNEGDLLANIDDSIYASQVVSAKALVEQANGQLASAKAGVTQAEANLKRAQADLLQAQAKQHQAEREWERARTLTRTSPGAISQADYDVAEANVRTAQAAVAVSNASIAQMQAALEDAKANIMKAEGNLNDAQARLHLAEVNLSYCTIKSPVKGVIIDRRVNVGQTVVASLNSPSLFLIAKDLRRMQVWASVNEADVANIKSGQAVRFAVDALPGRSFPGVVAPDQPRLNASMTQNVVTYTVIVNTDNTSGDLLPYLTANLDFRVNERKNALLVPNGALRYRPAPTQIAPGAEDPTAKSPGKRNEKTPDKGGAREPIDRNGVLWVEDSGYVRPIPVRTGLSDGVKTEIVGGDVREGDAVVVGEVRKDAGPAGTTNPFAPQMNRKKAP